MPAFPSRRRGVKLPPTRLDFDRASCDDYAMTNTPTADSIITLADALAALDAYAAADDDDCTHMLAIRDMLMHDLDLFDAPDADRELLIAIYHALDIQSLSMLRLDYSLCPMHAIDYAICFDDDDDACADIRAYFPNHDT